MALRLMSDLGFSFRLRLGLGMGGLAELVRVRISLLKIKRGGVNSF